MEQKHVTFGDLQVGEAFVLISGERYERKQDPSGTMRVYQKTEVLRGRLGDKFTYNAVWVATSLEELITLFPLRILTKRTAKVVRYTGTVITSGSN